MWIRGPFLHDDRANPVIAWPMRLFDCSPVSDGAACLLVVAEEIAHNFTDHPLHVVGYGQASGELAHDRTDLTSIGAARLAGQRAYETSGMTPKDIDVVEVHDCFTIAEVLASEDLGFFKPGQGYRAAEEGQTAAPDQFFRRPEVQGPSGRCHRCRTGRRNLEAVARRSGRTAGTRHASGGHDAQSGRQRTGLCRPHLREEGLRRCPTDVSIPAAFMSIWPKRN